MIATQQEYDAKLGPFVEALLRSFPEVSPKTGPARGVAGRQPAGAEGPGRFKHTGNKVISPPEPGAVVCVGSRCKRRCCPSCGPRLGFAVRRSLRAQADLWRAPSMFTLTIDRAAFPGGPEAAHARVTDGKFIPRLMALLGVRRWVWTLEFQTKTGDGWPHWHCLIDLADCPRPGWLDLKKAWRFWRDTWHIGGLDLSINGDGKKTAAHAVNYITKYLTKTPEGGYPEWVLHGHTVRFVAGSRLVGPLVGKLDSEDDDDDDPDDDDSEPAKLARMNNIDCISLCGLSTNLLREEFDGSTGELRYRFVGMFPASPAWLTATLPQHFTRVDNSLRNDGHSIHLTGGFSDVARDLSNYDLRQHFNEARTAQRQSILSTNKFLNRLHVASAPSAP